MQIDLDEDAALRMILEGTATETGERFFQALVQNLAKAMHTHGAWVTEYLADSHSLRALAFWLDGELIDNFEISIAGSPCERVIEGAKLLHYPDNVVTLYPDDPDLRAAGAVSYIGVPLKDINGEVLGHLAVMDRRPMPEEPHSLALFQIFAARAAAELQRIRAERDVVEREEKLSRLVDGAMDAIIELDTALCVTQLNPAAEKIFASSTAETQGVPFAQFMTEPEKLRLQELIHDIESQPDGPRCRWIPGGLQGLRADGEVFSAEATLSRYVRGQTPFYVLVLRDVHDRLEAERRIQALTDETQYLKEELKSTRDFGGIIGHSEALLRTLQDVQQVAATDATVLILGETGTGKELIARAIHEASPRHDKSLVKVNCAAIPANLIESELFGHERGAFTGATSRRTGRFALADGGTLFLDEVGELPLDFQSKLLRVLQEGEFELVGSSRTYHVDVRVIAATNRDLQREVQEGRFREDLFYRLNVFPIQIPPLRERGDDIPLLADAFSRRFAQRLGRNFAPLTPECIRRLKAYSWPGNVRELHNVIERAVITAQGNRLNLDRALPDSPEITTLPAAEEEQPIRIRTVHELEALERENLLRALKSADWRVSGENGAAQLLGMRPTTLSSRIKVLGIQRPR